MKVLYDKFDEKKYEEVVLLMRATAHLITYFKEGTKPHK